MKRRSQRRRLATRVEWMPPVGGLGSLVPDEGFEPPTFGLQNGAPTATDREMTGQLRILSRADLLALRRFVL